MAKAKQISDEQKLLCEQQIAERSKKIDFYTTEYSIELLASKLTTGVFVVPNYQREFTWEPLRKSKFIESLLMGLPIPYLFFWESPETGKLEIVDGSQRLRTIREYLENGLTILGLEELPALNGTRFSDLLTSRQNKFKNRSIRGIVLNEHADEQARFDMFGRINTGSKNANSAEVRRGALEGPFQSLIQELSLAEQLNELAPSVKKKQDLRVQEELVARFFAYGDAYRNDFADYKENPAGFVFQYVKAMNDNLRKDLNIGTEYKERFHNMLADVAKFFPFGFRKMATANSTPSVRFEAISIGVYLATKVSPELRALATWSVDSWLDSEGFQEVTTSDAANVKSKLKNRINFVKDRITSCL